MKRTLLISLIMAILAILAHNQALSQKPVSNSEVGIEEKLGDTIPMDLTFYNTANEEVMLKDIIDKPTVLSFVYFDCPGLCSPLMEGLSRVIEKTNLKLGQEYEVITISFNTKDTPEKAMQKKKNFVQQIGEDSRDSWVYLTGKQENIDKITDAAGFQYKRTGFDFAHPSAIIVLTPNGKISRYLYGVDYLPFNFQMAIGEAAKGNTTPTRNKVLQYCFSYDQQSQTYTLQITRIVGAITLVIAAIVLTILLVKGRRRKTA